MATIIFHTISWIQETNVKIPNSVTTRYLIRRETSLLPARNYGHKTAISDKIFAKFYCFLETPALE